MFSKRHTQIMRLLDEQGTLSTTVLADRLGVSGETVRRDIAALARDGKVARAHGAVSLPAAVGEAPFERRLRENAVEKRAIAKAVSAHIADGDSIMLDTGTTTSILARALLERRRLTVVTNSSDIARTLATVNGNRVYMAGGELRSDSGAAFGPAAVEFIARFQVDHAIISAGAIDSEGVMDYELGEAEFARMLLARGARRLVITDHTKFGRRGLVRVCGFDALDEMVTDRAPPDAIAQALALSGIRVTIA